MHALMAAACAARGHEVIFLTIDAHKDAPEIRALLGEVPVKRVLGRRAPGPMRLWQLAGAWRGLRRLLQEARPDVVYAVLDWANWLAVRASHAMAEAPPVVIGLANCMHHRGAARRFPEGRLCRSRPAAGVIANSQRGLAAASARGLQGGFMRVIHAGVDPDEYKPDRPGGRRIRGELGISEQTRLVGHVGRLHPVKDHHLLLRGFARMHPQTHLLCVGSGEGAYADALKRLAEQLGVSDRVTWWSRRQDLPAVYTACDVLALPSRSEGCPNVVMEAMACGTTCVVADVGAAADIVGERQYVLKERTPQALAKALTLPDRGEEPCRRRVLDHFTLEQCADHTVRALVEAARGREPATVYPRT